MKARVLPALLLASASAAAGVEIHSLRLTLPDGTRLSCFGVAGPYGSNTSCRPLSSRPGSAASARPVQIDIPPERQAAWRTAYRYLKRARTRYGWKAQTKGPLGRLLIAPGSVRLGDLQIDLDPLTVEEAVWQLTCRQLEIDPAPLR